MTSFRVEVVCRRCRRVLAWFDHTLPWLSAEPVDWSGSVPIPACSRCRGGPGPKRRLWSGDSPGTIRANLLMQRARLREPVEWSQRHAGAAYRLPL